jgi:hypothetical protein
VPGGEARVVGGEVRAPVAETGAYLLDPDPGLRRAGGVDELALEVGAARASENTSYLLAPFPPESPWLRSYPVREIFPYRLRDLARRLDAEPPRELIVKQRGLGLLETEIRRGVRLAAGGPVRVVVLYRSGRRRLAALCDAPV